MYIAKLITFQKSISVWCLFETSPATANGRLLVDELCHKCDIVHVEVFEH